MFVARLFTALVLLALFCSALFLLPNDLWGAFLLAGLAIAALEWAALVGYRRTACWLFATIVVASALVVWKTASAEALQLGLYWMATAFWLLVASWWLAAKWQTENRLALAATGWIVLLPTWLALTNLQRTPQELLGILAIVWIADSAAYFTGRRYGRHLLAPRISPGKTWEGVGGACVAVAVYHSVLWMLLGEQWSLRDAAHAAVLFAAITAMSVQGDLFESWMKRQAGVKDSGTLLPGHGGMLDRIDALTSSMPLAALWLHYLDRPGFL